MSEQDKEAVTNTEEQTSTEQAATQETNEPVVKDQGAEQPAAAEAGKQETKETQDIDYKAELEKVTQQRDQYKQGMLDAKDKMKRKGIEAPEVPTTPVMEDDSEAVEIIRKTVAEAVSKELAPLRSEILSDTFDTLLNSLSENEDEKKLIRFHYDNTINKTGVSKSAILQDLQNARAIANQKRLQRERDEAMLAAKNRAGLGRSSSVGNNQSQPNAGVDVSDLKFTTMEMEVIKRGAARLNISVEDYIKKHSLGQ